MQLPPAAAVALCTGGVWDGWEVPRLYEQSGPLCRAFSTPKQCESPGNSPPCWELWVDPASFPSLEGRTDPGWLRLKSVASGSVFPKGHLPATASLSTIPCGTGCVSRDWTMALAGTLPLECRLGQGYCLSCFHGQLITFSAENKEIMAISCLAEYLW